MILLNFNLSEAKKNALLQMAGKQLGTDPNALKAKLESGQMDDVVKNLDPKAAAQLNGLLQNPAALNALLGSDQLKGMLGNLTGKGK